MHEMIHPDLLTAISPQRLSRYLHACGGDAGKALALYQLNADIGASLWIDLMWLEVTLRNCVNSHLGTSFSASWFCDPAFTKHLEPLHHKLLTQAVEAVSKKSTLDTRDLAGRVIANLTFGFWVGLLSKGYTHSLWIPSLRKMFDASVISDRKLAHQQLEIIRKLRNRIAHHEPIFHLDLLAVDRAIDALLLSLNPAVAKFAGVHSRTQMMLKKLP